MSGEGARRGHFERPTGAELIAAERRRQVDVEGWTPEHDVEHYEDDLALAAACYALPPLPVGRGYGEDRPPFMWPWSARWWKPTPHDRVRELVKAGALIAAEIDRLQAAGASDA